MKKFTLLFIILSISIFSTNAAPTLMTFSINPSNGTNITLSSTNATPISVQYLFFRAADFNNPPTNFENIILQVRLVFVSGSQIIPINQYIQYDSYAFNGGDRISGNYGIDIPKGDNAGKQIALQYRYLKNGVWSGELLSGLRYTVVIPALPPPPPPPPTSPINGKFIRYDLMGDTYWGVGASYRILTSASQKALFGDNYTNFINTTLEHSSTQPTPLATPALRLDDDAGDHYTNAFLILNAATLYYVEERQQDPNNYYSYYYYLRKVNSVTKDFYKLNGQPYSPPNFSISNEISQGAYVLGPDLTY